MNSDTVNPEQPAITLAIPIQRPFPDVSRIELFDGKNFRRWKECVSTILDIHGVADALIESVPPPDTEQTKINSWTYANKVCRHTLISTLSNDLFDVYHVYKYPPHVSNKRLLAVLHTWI